MNKFLTLIMVLVCAGLYAQTDIQFQLTDVMTGRSVSTSGYSSSKGIVIIFTSNQCPYDEYYRKRVNALAAAYRDKVPVLLVNASPEPTETADLMKTRGGELNFLMPYLADKEQRLMSLLGARKTPEAFLLKNNQGKFSVVYRGAIDDNPQVEADVRTHYLRDAIDDLISGRPIEPTEARAVGCNLRKN